MMLALLQKNELKKKKLTKIKKWTFQQASAAFSTKIKLSSIPLYIIIVRRIDYDN